MPWRPFNCIHQESLCYLNMCHTVITYIADTVSWGGNVLLAHTCEWHMLISQSIDNSWQKWQPAAVLPDLCKHSKNNKFHSVSSKREHKESCCSSDEYAVNVCICWGPSFTLAWPLLAGSLWLPYLSWSRTQDASPLAASTPATAPVVLQSCSQFMHRTSHLAHNHIGMLSSFCSKTSACISRSWLFVSAC